MRNAFIKSGKNLLVFILGALLGLIFSVLYVILIWLPANAERIGLGIIALFPVTLIFAGIGGILIGGTAGILGYRAAKRYLM